MMRRCWAPLLVALGIGLTPQARAVSNDDIYEHMQFLQDEMRRLRNQLEGQTRRMQILEADSASRDRALERRLLRLEGDAPQAAEAAAPVSDSEDARSEARAYNAAYGRLRGDKYDRDALIAEFRRILRRWPQGVYAPNAWYWLGELHLLGESPDLDSARAAFETVRQRFASHSKAMDATFKLAKVVHKQGDAARAESLLRDIVARGGDSTNSVVRLAENYLRRYF